MKLFLTSIVLILCFQNYAQKDGHTCYKRNNFSNTLIKSNSLSLAQIAETERYDVHFYSLDLEMDNLSTDVAGTVEIHGKAKEDLDSVLFELFQSFTITEIRLNGTPSVYSRVNSAIKVPVNILDGQQFEIAIDYNGTPPTAATNPLGGAGMSNASSPSWGNQVTWSLSEPFSAYEWWPCKQSLTDKADSLDVKITVPNSCKAGSNGVLVNTVDLGNGFTRYEWEHRHAIDYYLVSVSVAEYIEYNVYANPAGSISPVLIQNYIYDNPGTLPNFQADIDETVDFIELFANLFGPYPFDDEKYGHSMAPISGGMEHQTMTTQGYFVKGLTAHELGHQWWGNNLTCASWADIWVNEGFASYSEHLMLENLYQQWESDANMVDVHNNVMSQPHGSVWVEDSLNENRLFSGRLSYDKGAAIIHTFRFIMNDDVDFFNALQALQIDFTDSTIYGTDVRDYFTAGSSADFTEPFNEWYFGEGYPTYSAKWNMVDGGVGSSSLFVEISHSTSSSTPTFTNPIEIEFSRTGMTDTIIRFDISSNQDFFEIENIQNISGLNSIDPNNWVINKVGSIIHDESLVSVNGIEAIPYFTVSPNPSSGIFSLQTSFDDQHSLVILDLKGREVLKSNFNQNLLIDLTDQDAGYYLVHIVNSKGEKRITTLLKK